MKTFLSAIVLSLVLVAASAAGEIREIELKDGSVLTGEVVSLANGIYTIKSGSLGTIKLEESKVRAIREKAPAAAPASGSAKTDTAGDVRAIQEKMMSDKEIMALIESLRDNAEFKKLLDDPAVMKAVQDGNIAALMANPGFLKLLDDPAVKEIEKKVK